MSYGVESGRPTYDQLCEASHGRARSYIVLQPGVTVTDWSNFSGNAYVAPFERVYRDLRRDVGSVLVTDKAPLTRVESVALCVSTAFSYYYDPDEEFAHPPFVWDKSYWDIGVLGGVNPTTSHYWDQFTRLYVNLGGADPMSTSVLATLGFYVGQESTVEPSLGDDLLAGAGSFENWS